MPGARKEFKGKDKETITKCQEQGKNLRKREGNRSEMLGERKDLREKRREQKRSAMSKERI